MSSALLEARDLWVAPRGAAPDAAPVVRGVDLVLHQGERVALMGPNGSGKSTLALALAGLVAPQQGIVRGPGRSGVGLVRQDPDDQFLTPSVEREAGLGLVFRGHSPGVVKPRVDRILERLHLTPHADRPPHELSAGEKQRVVLASFLALEPPLLVLDEPTSYLDEAGRAGLASALADRPSGAATLIITPFVEEARDADRLILMEDGRIAAEGSPADVLRDTNRLHALRLQPLWPPPSSERGAPATRVYSSYAATTETGHRLLARDVHAEYRTTRGVRPVLAGVDLTLRAGEIVGITGAAGTGKSTLLAVLAGLHPCSAGGVELDGEALSARSDDAWWRTSLRDWWEARGGKAAARRDGALRSDPSARRARIAVLFAFPEEQGVARTLVEDVAYGLERRSVPRQEAQRRAAASLAELGFGEGRFHDALESFSFGERRLASLAAVLVLEPDFLLLDEPTVGLDEANRHLVAKAIVACGKRGCGVLLASHDTRLTASIAHRVVRLREGRIEED